MEKKEMRLLCALRAQGCDVDGAMERFLNDSALYVSLLAVVPGEDAFARLAEAGALHDAKSAFEAAHTLKGVAGNMGLTPMYKTCCAVVEPLRAGKWDGVDTNCRLLEQQRAELAALLADGAEQ